MRPHSLSLTHGWLSFQNKTNYFINVECEADRTLADIFRRLCGLSKLDSRYWIADNDTSFQAKVDSNANLSFNYIQQINSSVKLGASVSLDAKDFAADTHSFGLSLTLF